jgi:hypothetical protein
MCAPSLWALLRVPVCERPTVSLSRFETAPGEQGGCEIASTPTASRPILRQHNIRVDIHAPFGVDPLRQKTPAGVEDRQRDQTLGYHGPVQYDDRLQIAERRAA